MWARSVVKLRRVGSTIPLMLMDLADRLIPCPIRHPADLVRLAC
jgi:hypothetical protein